MGSGAKSVTRIRLGFVQAFTVRGKPSYYFRRPGRARVKLPGLPGSEPFMEAYRAALAASLPPSDIGASRNAPGTVGSLVALYAGSSQFKHEIAPATRRTDGGDPATVSGRTRHQAGLTLAP